MGNPQGFVELLKDDILGRKKHFYEIQRYTVQYADDDGKILFEDDEYE